MLNARLQLMLKKGARVERDNAGLCIVDDGRVCTFADLSGLARKCVLSIGKGIHTMAEVRALLGAEADPASEAILLMILRLLSAAGLLRYGFHIGSALVAEIVPENERFVPRQDVSPKERSEDLLPHTSLRNTAEGWTLSSPLADCRILVKQTGVLTELFALADANRQKRYVPHTADAESLANAAFVSLLHLAGFIIEPTDARSLSGACWTFHDLEFHRRTRLGYTSGFKGAKTSIVPRDCPPPHVPDSDTIVWLVQPEGVSQSDQATLLSVLARRQSHREPAAHPLSLPALSVFLATSFVRENEDGLSHRPFPRAGGLDIYGVYLTVRDCHGLEEGFYFFDANRHALLRLPVDSEALGVAFERAAGAMGASIPPQVIVTVTARFDTINDRYQDTAYRLVLLTGGAVLQTMYLTATALGLAPCGLGSGDSAAFCRLAGLDPLVEDAILEFALSSWAEA